jgi:hypothetical protein
MGEQPTPSPLDPSEADLNRIRNAISKDLTTDVTIPDGHRGALITYANLDHIEVAMATKIVSNDKFEWDVEFIASHEWTGQHQNEVGVLSKITW